MTLETPQALLARLKLGREEYCQRLLTMLILDAPYPAWNSPHQPSAAGLAFLAALDALSFPESKFGRPEAFVDEFELPARSDDEHAGWPDYALLWDDRLWIIELKTESASHRPGQLAHYADLARHHHPTKTIDITYLAPPITKALDEVPADIGLTHVFWTDVVPLVAGAWSDGDAWQESAVAALTDVLDRSRVAWSHARPRLVTLNAATEQGLELAEATAADGAQRAIDVPMTDPEDMDDCRLQINNALRSAPDGAAVRHVRPWIWRAQTSGGQPLTTTGMETGYELRLSRYVEPY